MKFLASISLLWISHLVNAQDVDYHKKLTFVIAGSESAPTLTCKVEVTIRVLSDNATEWNRMLIQEPGYLNIGNLTASHNSKPVQKSSITSFYPQRQDVFLTGNRVHIVPFTEKSRKGDVFRCQYTERYQSLAYLPVIEFPRMDARSKLDIEFEHPNDLTVSFETVFSRDSLRSLASHTGKKTTITFFDSIPPVLLPYLPLQGTRALIIPSVSRKGRALTPRLPQSFSEWYLRQLDSADMNAVELSVFLKSLVNEARTRRDTIRVLHEFIRDSIRYISLNEKGHSIFPHRPKLVLKNRYGDCKDRAFLLTAWGKQFNIDVDMVLLSVAKPSWSTYSIHPALYDHVICRIADPAGDLFVDPTSKYTEFGNLPESDVGSRALVLDSLIAADILIPPMNEMPSLDLTVVADIDSLRMATAILILRNDHLASVRKQLENPKKEEFDNHLSLIVGAYLSRIALDRFVVISQNDSAIHVRANADLSDFVIRSSGKAFIPQTPFRPIKSDLMDRQADPYPIFLDHRPSLSMTLILNAPRFKSQDERWSIGQNDRYSFRTDTRINAEGPVEYRYNFAIRQKHFDGTAKIDFLSFCKLYFSRRNSFYSLEERNP
jgi:hypothetical protein